jgi:hypothetical protein
VWQTHVRRKTHKSSNVFENERGDFLNEFCRCLVGKKSKNTRRDTYSSRFKKPVMKPFSLLMHFVISGGLGYTIDDLREGEPNAFG